MSNNAASVMLKRLSEEFQSKRKLARLKRNVLPPQCLRRWAGTFTTVAFYLLSINSASLASIILIGSSTDQQYLQLHAISPKSTSPSESSHPPYPPQNACEPP